MDTPFIIYHSGDKGSQELMDLLTSRNVRFTPRDIRKDRAHLVRLLNLGKQTVPQIVYEGEYFGDYEVLEQWVNANYPAPQEAQQEPQQA